MNYNGRTLGQDTELSLEREGLRLGSRFLDLSENKALRPLIHRVQLETLAGDEIENSMLGFSYDGFWEELMDLFGKRSLEALFVEESLVMLSEGEYQTPRESGRAKIALFPDAVCILPQTCNAVRIPLCFAEEIRLDGYLLHLTLASGARYTVGRMGYDTKPFAERAQQASDQVKKTRARLLSPLTLQDLFTVKGLFRTGQTEEHWQAAFGHGVCAVELFTKEDAATYLYRFTEPEMVFRAQLEEAMEAMGSHREIIYFTEEQLAEKPLYRMAVQRNDAVTFLRGHSAGRLIHNATHAQRLREFLG